MTISDGEMCSALFPFRHPAFFGTEFLMLEPAIDTVSNTFGLCGEHRVILRSFSKTLRSHATVSSGHRNIPKNLPRATRCVDQIDTRQREPFPTASLPVAKQKHAMSCFSIDAGRTLPMCKSPFRRDGAVNLPGPNTEQPYPQSILPSGESRGASSPSTACSSASAVSTSKKRRSLEQRYGARR